MLRRGCSRRLRDEPGENIYASVARRHVIMDGASTIQPWSKPRKQCFLPPCLKLNEQRDYHAPELHLVTESTTAESASFFEALKVMLFTVLDVVPDLLAAALVLVAGWLIARALRSVVRRMALASNRFLERFIPRGQVTTALISSASATLVGEIVFWVVLLVAVSLASGVAGFSALSAWLAQITIHLPNLVAGLAILVVGYFLGVYVREQIAPQNDDKLTRRHRSLGKAAQVAVVAVALIVGLDQVGIDVTLLVALVAVAIAALLAGLSMAFALGARRHVSNLVGIQSARRSLAVGMRVRIGDEEGEILEFTSTQLALETDAGKTFLPARMLDDMPVTVLSPDTRESAADG